VKPEWKRFFTILAAALVIGAALATRSCNSDGPVQAVDAAEQPVEAPVEPAEPEPPPRQPFTYAHSMQTLPARLQAQIPGRATGVLVDYDSRRILWAHKADSLVPIASMTKLMTVLVVLEDVYERERYTLQSQTTVSKAAAGIGGSQVWLAPGEVFSMEELMQAAMIHSANDAAYAAAEAAGGGDVKKFVTRMNRRAREIGMLKARFFNPNGLPGDTVDRDCKASALEMVVLADHLMDYPDALRWSSTWQTPFRPQAEKPVQMVSRNRLIRSCEGVDGLKTGFIQRAGSCVTATCTRGDRRMLVVVTGFDNARHRDGFVCELLDWGYAGLAPPAAVVPGHEVRP
jgi:D-alanyl-D-alanine carboxypeptidase (penicillin-binding protein 5/6)